MKKCICLLLLSGIGLMGLLTCAVCAQEAPGVPKYNIAPPTDASERGVDITVKPNGDVADPPVNVVIPRPCTPAGAQAKFNIVDPVAPKPCARAGGQAKFNIVAAPPAPLPCVPATAPLPCAPSRLGGSGHYHASYGYPVVVSPQFPAPVYARPSLFGGFFGH